MPLQQMSTPTASDDGLVERALALASAIEYAAYEDDEDASSEVALLRDVAARITALTAQVAELERERDAWQTASERDTKESVFQSDRADAAEARAERLKLEAQAHAQEARTANGTIAEIYQACSGARGEPGSWNGAKPVIDALAAAEARALAAERDAERLRLGLRNCLVLAMRRARNANAEQEFWRHIVRMCGEADVKPSVLRNDSLLRDAASRKQTTGGAE